MDIKRGESLKVARYIDDNSLIDIRDFQLNIHRGKIVCPICGIPLKHYGSDHFRAKEKGGHEPYCKKHLIHYYSTNSNTRKYIEIIDTKQGSETTVKINIKTFHHAAKMANPGNSLLISSTPSKHSYPKTQGSVTVFRDVITTVFQMKRLLRNNDKQDLDDVSFMFEDTGNQPLKFAEAVFFGNNARKAPHGKYRFVVLKSNNCVCKEKSYINSYQIEGHQSTVVLHYPYNQEALDNYKDKIIIVYGEIAQQPKKDKTYININNDWQFVTLNDLESWFKGVKFEKPKFRNYNKPSDSLKTEEPINSQKRTQDRVVTVSNELSSEEENEPDEKYVPNKANKSVKFQRNITPPRRFGTTTTPEKVDTTTSISSFNADNDKEEEPYKEPLKRYSAPKHGILDKLLSPFRKLFEMKK